MPPRLWRCPKCGAKFVSANMSHSCGRYRTDDLFARSDPRVVDLFERFGRMVKACGPVTTVPQKTRLVFMTRMRFAAVYPRKAVLRIHLVVTRRLPADPRLEKVETFGPNSLVHTYRIERREDLDATLAAWVQEAYDRGCQKHLRAVEPRTPSLRPQNRAVRPKNTRG
ncbi:MAG TPA: DUF5655 domain-containing protein [Vicinamibacterales bacterium]|nr:DUF5655 domain-containing protein [Vicinamibacterales bacterium]